MSVLRDYQRAWLRPDIVAGLTAAAVVVPKSMAYATIAGLPVQVGLYTAIVPMVIYALLGTSRPLSVSTTTTIAILTAAAVGEAAPGAGQSDLVAASATLAMLVGGMLLLARVLRLGFVANFISEPVLTGFKSGIGLVIIVDQLPKLLGIHIQKAGFFRDIASVIGHVPDASIATVALAVSLLLLIFLMEHFTPKLPAPLIAVAASIAATSMLGLAASGVAVIGEIPSSLPSLTWPQLDLVGKLWPAAIGIALMSFTESIAAARAFADPAEPRPIPNRELLALGVANVAGGLLTAMPAGGGTSQTAVNRLAGARSQMAEVVTAVAALAILLLLAPLMAQMPQGARAAVVVAYSLGLIQPHDFREIRAVRATEFWWALVALAGVMLLGTLKGILVAVILSLLSLAQQAYSPPVYVVGRKRGTNVFRPLHADHPNDEQWPGLIILRVEGRVFFANAAQIGERATRLITEARAAVVLIDCSAVIDLEYTALKMLSEAEERLRREGVELWLAALNPSVRAMVNRSPLGQALGGSRMFFDLEHAVEAYRSRKA